MTISRPISPKSVHYLRRYRPMKIIGNLRSAGESAEHSKTTTEAQDVPMEDAAETSSNHKKKTQKLSSGEAAAIIDT